MSITIDDLDEPVTQKLRQPGQQSRTIPRRRSPRDIDAGRGGDGQRSPDDPAAPTIQPPRTPEEMRERLLAVTGIWRDRAGGKTTDEIMKELRGDD